MINTHEKFRVQDVNKVNDFFLEVNWSPKDKKTNECKLIRVNFGDKEAVIDRDKFIAILFALGKPEQQMKMIPQKVISTQFAEVLLKVKATKDLRKGEELIFPYKYPVYTKEQMVMGDTSKLTN